MPSETACLMCGKEHSTPKVMELSKLRDLLEEYHECIWGTLETTRALLKEIDRLTSEVNHLRSLMEERT